MNLLAHHLNVLEGAGLIERRRSEGDARRRYVVLRHEVMATVGIVRPDWHGRLAFVCTHNSARSQYAAAFARSLGFEASSAGLAPAERVHPMAVDVAAERGIDLSAERPRGYEELEERLDLVISVCDRAGEDAPPQAVGASSLVGTRPGDPWIDRRIQVRVRRSRTANVGVGQTMNRRAVLAETLGTGLLLYMIVGSGVAAERLSLDPAVTLMTHAAVVGASLTVLIWMFGPVSGAHFNPVVTVALWRTGLIGRN